MSVPVRIARNTDSGFVLAGSVPASGELIYKTDAHALAVGDGVTAAADLLTFGGEMVIPRLTPSAVDGSGNMTFDATMAAANAVALIAALAVTPAHGALFVPSGSYQIDREITIPSNITVAGIGRPLIYQKVNGQRAFVGVNVKNVRVSGLRFRGVGSATTFTTGFSLVEFWSAGALGVNRGENVEIDHCEIWDCHSALTVSSIDRAAVHHNKIHDFLLFGVLASHSSGFKIDFNHIYDCDQVGAANSYGVMATGDVGSGYASQERNSVSFNHIWNIVSWDAVMTHECKRLNIIGNVINNVRTGIDLTTEVGPIEDVIVAGNHITLTTENAYGGTGAIHGGVLAIASGPAPTIKGLVITGNLIVGPNKISGYTATGNFYSAIILENVQDVDCSDNVIRDIGSSVGGFNGISVFRSPGRVTIANNVMSGVSTGYGVRYTNAAAGTSADIQIVNNTWRSAGDEIGVILDVGTFERVVVAGNISNVTRLQWASIDGATVVKLIKGHGTFTPVLKIGGVTTGITYALQHGEYEIDGNKVSINIMIRLTSKGSGTGAVTVDGLPFTAHSSHEYQALNCWADSYLFTPPNLLAYIQGTLKLVQLSYMAAGAQANFTDANVGNTFRLAVTGTYLINNQAVQS